jgi:aryl-alcohol dehydrogenase-like predicted oxidoreductase
MTMLESTYRRLGQTELALSPIGLGCWPIAGISTLDVSDAQSIQTIRAAVDCGINHFDTAYSYGYDGQADRLLATALAGDLNHVAIASKVGTHYDPSRQRVVDGRPETLIRHAGQALDRLGVSQVTIIYLHTPDPNVPLAESADAIAEIVRRGWARQAGVSNVNLDQLRLFHTRCPVTITQPYFNMLQQEQVQQLKKYCLDEGISIAAYWVLMKGLLAGKMARDHQFDPSDRRLTYAIYQGQAWQRAQDLLDQLRGIAKELDCTVAQLVIAWTLQQAGVTYALCGAKRPEQIAETARAMTLKLDASAISRIDSAISRYAA